MSPIARIRPNQPVRHLAMSLMVAATLACAAHAADPAPGSYRVIDGKVDKRTFDGWVLYHTACFICHGRDATGSEVAPSLLPALKSMDKQTFANKVLTRYRLAFGPDEASTEQQPDVRDLVLSEVRKSERGQAGMVHMPAWQDNAGVQAHLLDLYAYLKARADGVLGTGQPMVAPR